MTARKISKIFEMNDSYEDEEDNLIVRAFTSGASGVAYPLEIVVSNSGAWGQSIGASIVLNKALAIELVAALNKWIEDNS
jgi:hypothetical protein